MTNGVSFSLVAGSGCIVYFSNMIGPGNITSNDPSRNPSFSPTLNINSLGAKSMVNNRNTTAWSTAISIMTSSYYRIVVQDGGTTLYCIYDGSRYLTVGASGGKASSYSDYSD